MEIAELLDTESVVAKLPATSKKQALQELAKRAAQITGLHERAVFDVLLERERLGTTGVGNGIAIPHGERSPMRVFSVANATEDWGAAFSGVNTLGGERITARAAWDRQR